MLNILHNYHSIYYNNSVSAQHKNTTVNVVKEIQLGHTGRQFPKRKGKISRLLTAWNNSDRKQLIR